MFFHCSVYQVLNNDFCKWILFHLLFTVMGAEVVQVVPQGIESVNGSSDNMGCTSSLVDSDGVMVCESGSYLVDGCSPDIDTSTSDWASQLVTVRRSDGPDLNFPHVLLTFGFDMNVSLTGIEMDWFLCPDWNISAPDIAVYLNEDYKLTSTNILTLPFVFADNKDSLQSSCDSLSTVTFSGGSFEGSYYRTIHILVTLLEYPSIEWVHVGEVRFIGIDSPTCTQPTLPSSPTITPPPEPLFSFSTPLAEISSTASFFPSHNATNAFLSSEEATATASNRLPASSKWFRTKKHRGKEGEGGGACAVEVAEIKQFIDLLLGSLGLSQLSMK